jgi:hypothetical protein
MDFEKNIRKYAGQPLLKQVLLDLLKEYKRPFDKLDDLVKQQVLTQVRRGVYIPGPNLDMQGPEPFLLANHLYGPSYVSLDAALSYWELIPEQVYEITSVTTRNTRQFISAAGRFTYRHMPSPWYSYGIQQVKLADKQTALLAGKEKALCDKLIATAGLQLRSIPQARQLLTEDLRMEPETLKSLDTEMMAGWLSEAPKRRTIEILIKTLDSL